MTLKGLIKTFVAGLIFVTTVSCGGNKEMIDTKAMLAYNKEPNEQNMEVLSKSYSAYINKNRKSGVKVPGIYSDYAVMLVKQGKRAEANGWFNKEMEAFPSSRSYVLQLKRRLIPEYQDNNSTEAADNDTIAAEPDALTPVQRKKAEQRAAKVMGDTVATETEAAIENEEAPDNSVEGDEGLKDEEGVKVEEGVKEEDGVKEETDAKEEEDARESLSGEKETKQ